jgi:uncharacterized protein (TIGR02757 family)
VIEACGSLHGAFQAQMQPDHDCVVPALDRFCRLIVDAAGTDLGHLLPLPNRGSACKRMNLFLRWMVRQDAVDPGGWEAVPVTGLVIPLDVHMHRVGRKLGFTERKQADMKTALEITEGFKQLVPEDPVRYDFALTRPGIWGDGGVDEFCLS